MPDAVATVELRYQDGDVERLTPVDGFLLHVIAPEHHAVGRRLEAIVTRDRAGRDVVRRTVGANARGIYPCRGGEEIELGYGQTICP